MTDAVPVPSHQMIERLLVANRGEVARRVFRTCRRLGIGTVAVYSDPDADAAFVSEADIAVGLGGASAVDSYLRGDAVIEAARRAGADAVHPGYGFLSENSEFARAVLDAGLIWVGPSPQAIAAMGSKTEARDRMERAGVPVLPGARLDGEPQSTVETVADGIGYPILVKASAGGGGKGMRRVRERAELAGAIEAARREAAAAFGNDAVFLERFATGARHVEIQIVGDAHGQVCSLHERDCSVQRRHQKVIEESPSPAVTPEIRARMSAAAVAAGEALGYVGAGTVEFLLTGDEFFFLEVNTRLQVEHPVTELVTGLDLVELQLLVAEGRTLPDAVTEPPIKGHAIEARLYAEDAAGGFLPATGLVERFGVPAGVRVDSAVVDGTVITPHYDPMIAKVIAHGATRDEAVRRLVDALRRAEIHGLTTNRDFLVRVLAHEEFRSGNADTGFLDRHDLASLTAPLVLAPEAGNAAAAAALAAQALRRSQAGVVGTLPSGWRNNPSGPQTTTFQTRDGGELIVEYRMSRDGRLSALRVNGRDLPAATLHDASESEVDLEVDGVRRRYRVHSRAGGAVSVNTEVGQLDLVEAERFPEVGAVSQPGSLQSPLPGRVIRVLVETGAMVEPGDPLIIVEAMKMEHEIVAPHAGAITALRVSEGHQVETGTLLAVID